MTRALVWAFHDVDGVLDAANARYLRALLEHVEHAVVVVNGELDDAGRSLIAALGAELIVRENHGYDVEAFKAGVTALESRLPELDELVIANSSVFGPLRPLAEMFDRMAEVDVDLWGITRHAPANPESGTTAPRAERAHIQSYFTAYRASVLRSAAFADYWHALPPIEGYADAVRLHELQQTGYFEDHGFTWQVAVDTADLEHLSTNPIIGLSAQLVRERGCPVFKRRMLYLSTEELTVHSDGAATAELWRLLRELPAEQRDELVAHAIRTMPADRLRRTLQDAVWLDAPAQAHTDTAETADGAVAILDGPMARASVLEWAAAIGPERVALLGDRDDSPAASAATEAGVRVLSPGDRPAMLAALDLDAELLLVLGDDARPGWAEDARIARSHARAALGSGAEALRAAGAAFRDDPTLGAIVPPTALGRRLVGSQARLPDARARAALEAAAPGKPIGQPLAPTPGASLWVRRAALEHLAEITAGVRGVRQLDHPTLVSVLVQGLGTIGLRARTGITRAAAATRVELGDAALSAIAAAVGAGAHDTLADVIARAGGRPLDASIFFDTGGGYRHVGAVQQTFPNGGPAVLQAVVPDGTLGIRFDPAEGTGLLVSGIRVDERGYRIRPVNGSRAGSLDLFSTHDPAYDVAGPLRPGDTITIRIEHAERIDGSTAALERIERRFGPLGPLGRVRSAGVRVVRKASRVVRSRMR
ncbi:rhamnan synthesis F family protein [Agrococcus sp. Marseille-P2731]|uniref:rhamnan synthesis F family protein n=1 Tax=Agrococcus sp. Marseille-P2731 TaxID=1841862 RepID=UPI0013563EBF|nr:rhamnan synthesis F family protein [Agrococcus sp. Marseille-P2731]